MKSTEDALRKRGAIVDSDIKMGKDLSKEQLIELLSSKSASERSLAIHVLGMRYPEDITLAGRFLELLCKEDCLYTRIELCDALQCGNPSIAKLMTGYLGVIGGNQHHVLPATVSKKVSFPLPRDLIARTLGRMSTDCFPVLLEVLSGDDSSRISEVLDAIGYMAFYHPELATVEHEQSVFRILENYQDNSLLVWKAILCLSAFPTKTCIEFLQKIGQQQNEPLIKDEIARSLRLINRTS